MANDLEEAASKAEAVVDRVAMGTNGDDLWEIQVRKGRKQLDRELNE